VICSNPPYSILSKVLDRCIELEPRVVQFVISGMALTSRRLLNFENAGYFVTKQHQVAVRTPKGSPSFGFGRIFVVQWEKLAERPSGVAMTLEAATFC